jgi:glycine cleavage system H protein
VQKTTPFNKLGNNGARTMRDPSELRYTRTHEWAEVRRNTIVVGITDYAQAHLPDIMNVELPEPDEHHYEANEEFCVIASLRNSRGCLTPVAGTVVAINTELLSRPELINHDSYGAGWLIELKPDSMDDVDELMDADEYEASLPEEEEE